LQATHSQKYLGALLTICAFIFHSAAAFSSTLFFLFLLRRIRSAGSMARAEPALYRRPFFFLSLSVCVCVENIKNPENILQCFSALMLCVVTFFSLDGKGEKMGFLTFSVPVRTRIVNGIFFFFFFFQFFSVVVDLYKNAKIRQISKRTRIKLPAYRDASTAAHDLLFLKNSFLLFFSPLVSFFIMTTTTGLSPEI
jgi:hypothetical protein